jgi:hypothetical protein
MNPTRSTVRHLPIVGQTVAECLSNITNMCVAGTASPDVQANPVALQAIGVLQKAVTTASGSLASRLSLAQGLMNAIRVLGVDFGQVRVALVTYEAAVNAMANGSASVITKAGCLASGPRGPAAALGPVTVVHSKPGKTPGEALLSWPAGPGATGYGLQVNFTPQTPSGPWTTLTSGTGRRRIVKASAPGAQFLVQVASLGTDGTQSAWSDAILATAL